MQRLLLALCFTLSGVCILAFPDVAASSTPAAEPSAAKETANTNLALRSEPDRAYGSAPAEARSGPATPAPTSPSRPEPVEANPVETGSPGSSALSGSSDPSDSSQPSSPKREPALTSIPTNEEFCTLLMSSAKANTLPIGFFANLIWQESRFVRTAVSSAGALGVAQFMPAVADRMGIRNPFDPREALPASARLLRVLHAQFGNLGLAAAAYNAGPKRVVDWLAKRGRLPQETRNYVLTITGRPAEHWIGPPPPIVFEVPARVPCFQVEAFSAAVKMADSRPRRENVSAPKSSGIKAAQRSLVMKVAKASRLAKKLPASVKTAIRSARVKVSISRRAGLAKVAALRVPPKTVQR
jgi:hypothetical protein